MLHTWFTGHVRSFLKAIARFDYDHPKAVLLATLAFAATISMAAVPSVISWVHYPCGGTLYDSASCYPQLADIAGPLNGKMHLARQFLFEHFPTEPWPRKAEIIVEPAERCLRCPAVLVDCTFDYAFDQCWKEDFTSVAPGPKSLPPLPPSALAALADAQATLMRLDIGSACWKVGGACHAANVSSSEFGAAVGVPAKQAWVPLESGGDELKASLHEQFATADGALPPALKYSFFVTGVSRDGYDGFPSQYSKAALEFENEWHVAMKEVAAKYPELTISWIGQSQPMTEFAMELFPPMLLCLPLAFSVLITIVVLAFATIEPTSGKLVLPLALADLLEPAICFLVANLAVRTASASRASSPIPTLTCTLTHHPHPSPSPFNFTLHPHPSTPPSPSPSTYPR